MAGTVRLLEYLFNHVLHAVKTRRNNDSDENVSSAFILVTLTKQMM